MAANADPKQILIEHGEKIALGAALVLAALVFVMSGGGDAQNTASEIDRTLGQIKSKMTKGVPDDQKKQVPDQLSKIKEPWGETTAKLPESLPWTYYRQPTVKINKSKGPPPVVVTQMPKNGIRARATRKLIEVEWDTPPSSGKDNNGETRSRARMLGYELHKWRKGQESKVRKLYLGSGTTTFSDSEFDPEATYVYKVRAYFEYERPGAKEFKASEVHGGTPGKIEGGDSAGSKVRFTQWTDQASVTTALNIALRYRSRLGTKATMYVWKFYKGKWWRMSFKVDLGDSVGATVSAAQLTKDSYNKSNRAGDSAYQDLQKADDKDTANIPWESGYNYLGYMRKSRTDYVVLEHQEVELRGLFGIDWGQKHIELAKSDDEGAPKDEETPK